MDTFLHLSSTVLLFLEITAKMITDKMIDIQKNVKLQIAHIRDT